MKQEKRFESEKNSSQLSYSSLWSKSIEET